MNYNHFIINPTVLRTIGEGKDAEQIEVHLECEAYMDGDHVEVVHGSSRVTKDARLDNGYVMYRKGELHMPNDDDQDALIAAAKAVEADRQETAREAWDYRMAA